jgi:hypothetical protein
MITPMRTRAPRTTHSQISGELDPPADAAEPLGWAAGAGAAALWVADGWAAGVSGTLALGKMLARVLGTMPAPALGEKLPLRLGARPETGPPLPPHPVTEHAAKPNAAARSRPPAKRRMPDPSAMKRKLSQDVA